MKLNDTREFIRVFLFLCVLENLSLYIKKTKLQKCLCERMKSFLGLWRSFQKAFVNNEYFWKHHKHLMPKRELCHFTLEPSPFVSVTERWTANVWLQQKWCIRKLQSVLIHRRGSGREWWETDSWPSITKNNWTVKPFSNQSSLSYASPPPMTLECSNVLEAYLLKSVCKYIHMYSQPTNLL